MTVRILLGDCRALLAGLGSNSVHCCITSPPYFGLRDYGTAQWEGGDLACDHVVGEIRTGLGLAKLGEQYRGGGHKAAVPKPMMAKGICPRCGAVRVDRQIGLEPTLAEYLTGMVDVFREVRRVLRDDGTCWINMGDSYASGGGSGDQGSRGARYGRRHTQEALPNTRAKAHGAIKPKDLMMVPARLAIALCDDGWWLRKDIIWHKPNPMPESCTDRPTSSHEHIFLLAKSGSPTFWIHRDGKGARQQPMPDWRWRHRDTGEELSTAPPMWQDHEEVRKIWRRVNLWEASDYFFDAEGVREADAGQDHARNILTPPDRSGGHLSPDSGIRTSGIRTSGGRNGSGRNLRDVWTIATSPFPEAHFATFPPDLPELCIKAGTSEHGCCPACGAPWARLVEKGKPDLEAQRAAGGDANGQYAGQSTKGHDQAGVQNASDVKRRILEGMRERLTTGWSPTCDCPSASPVPCTVLDPFLGAGTTAMVADRLGRDAIGVELNPGYAAMARRRIEGDAGMFARIA